jgi:(E)-4-hydroxy-3-methylbut-2-enyl-diphosphate synthase
VAPVFEDGKKVATLRGDDIAEQFKQRLEAYVESHYAMPQTGEVACG